MKIQSGTGLFRVFILLLLISGSTLINSCKHEPLIPKGGGDGGGDDDPDTTGTGVPCNPNTVYFNQQILPILASSCAKSGCHDAASAEEGVILNSYSNVMVTGEVTPFDPGDSEIWQVITESDPDDKMPPPGENPLTTDQINLIALWINQGAQNLYCDDNLGPCDSVNVAFTANIRPIIQNKCVGCHVTANSTNGNVGLASYAGVAAIAANGKLVNVIKHLPGVSAMPKNAPKLSDCEIAKISTWVTGGYPNN